MLARHAASSISRAPASRLRDAHSSFVLATLLRPRALMCRVAHECFGGTIDPRAFEATLDRHDEQGSFGLLSISAGSFDPIDRVAYVAGTGAALAAETRAGCGRYGKTISSTSLNGTKTPSPVT